MLSIQTVETAVDMVVVVTDTGLLRLSGGQVVAPQQPGNELPEAEKKDASAPPDVPLHVKEEEEPDVPLHVKEEEEKSEAETATLNVCAECHGVLMFHAEGLRVCKACGYIMESVHVYSCESESD